MFNIEKYLFFNYILDDESDFKVALITNEE